MPDILRYTGVSIMLDPALSATVAATGLYFRDNNKYEDLWIDNNEGTTCNLQQKSIALDLLQLWVPYLQLSDLATALADRGNGVPGRLLQLKKVILEGMSWKKMAEVEDRFRVCCIVAIFLVNVLPVIYNHLLLSQKRIKQGMPIIIAPTRLNTCDRLINCAAYNLFGNLLGSLHGSLNLVASKCKNFSSTAK